MQYIFEKMKIEELEETIALVKRVFDEFETPYYSQEGIENFYKFASYDNLKALLSRNMQMIVAKDNSKIIGMIAFRDNSHISMLFVNKNYHKQGIASNLVKMAKFQCRENNMELQTITVNSSPYAVCFYHKLGFVDTNSEQLVDGIRFTPMKLDVYNFKEYAEEYFEYLYQTKKECFKWYVEKCYGEWKDDFQIKFFKDEMEKLKQNVHMITYKNSIIGLLINDINEENESVIHLIYIDKKYQGKGIGTQILEEQLQIDKENNRNTILRVFKENPARFLYQRLGFEIYGETEFHYLMRRVLKKES